MGTPYFGFTEKGLAKQNTLQGEGLQKGLERKTFDFKGVDGVNITK